MSDLISRQAAIDAVHSTIFDFFDIVEDDSDSPMTESDKRLLELNKAITTAIRRLPTIDAVPVVRCGECEFYTEEERWCRRLGLCGAFAPNGYCSWGERRSDG